jgi:hypothetical protein
VHGHRLRRVFNPAGDAEAAARAQRVIGSTVSTAAAADMLRIPVDNLLEQAHAAMVGNILFDPEAV